MPVRKNRRNLGKSEKLSDLNVSWLWVKERKKECEKEGVKYLRLLYKPKNITRLLWSL